jgi:HD-GYP domain-containing protein (c-di-GMP phosphodiesterase class II)
MFIQGFGGSWFKHPFWSSKFLIETAEDIAKVRHSAVPYVLIDDALGLRPEEDEAPRPAAVAPSRPAPAPTPRRAAVAAAPDPFTEDKRAADRKAAQRLVNRSKTVMKGVFDRARLGRAVRVAEVVDIVDEISETVARSPHALLSVTRLKTKDEYTYLHSVAVCTLMVNIARHLGMDDDQTRDLGLAGLLHDIGKMGVPEPVLNKNGRLTDEEFAMVKEHPAHGHRMLLEAPDMVAAALDVCLHHHEKMDGTGYPFGLDRTQISTEARLGAICDVYDALTSDRPYKDAWTPAEAIAAMWSWKGHFDRKLLFAFMQSVGVFPAGMLVQLRSNRLGLVLDNPRRASRPRVCAFYATRDREFCGPEIVTIKDSLDGDQIVAPEKPANWGFTDWEAMVELLVRGELPDGDAGSVQSAA